MTDKYYTPTLEEFHIGFEFEIFEQGGKLISSVPPIVEQWRKTSYEPDDDCLIGDVIGWIKDKKVRVKYLNREDIESCGFMPVIPSNQPDKENYIPNWWVTDMYKDSFQLLECNPHEYAISFGQHEYSKQLFKGMIKNKSELKVLMKQLNIQP